MNILECTCCGSGVDTIEIIDDICIECMQMCNIHAECKYCEALVDFSTLEAGICYQCHALLNNH